MEERLEALEIYLSELYRWNKAYNLVGRRTTWEGLIEHAVDSLTPLMYRKLFHSEAETLDLGSGAGFPGYPLYIACGPFPLTLVEPMRKRYAFLRHIRRELKMEKVEILPLRGEEMAKEEKYLNSFDLVFARALTDYQKTMKLARPLLSSGGNLVLFLGKEDGEKLSKEGKSLDRGGYSLANLRSVKKITGKDNFLAILEKVEQV
jgi:16S rRNA (guanine527-N7)-methyltransferase